MKYLRYLHKTWDYFWRTVIILTATVIFLGLIFFGLLQLQSSKNYIANRVEMVFSNQFDGVISIGSFEGFIPYEIRLTDVNVYPDSSSLDPLVTIDSLTFGLDPFQLVQRQLVVNNLTMNSPVVSLSEEGNKDHSLASLFKVTGKSSVADSASKEKAIEFQVPSLIITNGTFTLGEFASEDSNLSLPKQLVFENIESDLFLDLSPEAQFIDIEALSFDLRDSNLGELNLTGQLFNDDKFLEFNAFRVELEKSFIDFGFELSGVNSREMTLQKVFKEAFYNVDINSSYINVEELSQVYSLDALPSSSIQLEFHGNGSIDSLDIERISLVSDQHIVVANGYVNDVDSKDELNYALNIEQAHFEGDDLEFLNLNLSEAQQAAITNLQWSGDISGSLKDLNTSLSLSSDRGNLDITATTGLKKNAPLFASIKMDSLNIAGLIPTDLDSTSITGELNLDVSSTDYKVAIGQFNMSLQDIYVDKYQFDSILGESSFNEGVFDPRLIVRDGITQIQIRSNVDLASLQHTYRLNADISRFNFADYLDFDGLEMTDSNLRLEINAEGNSLPELFGQLSIDADSSIVNGERIGLHQLYVDLNSPEENRVLRLTSTPVDLTLSGDINPINIQKLAYHWSDYFVDRYKSELVFSDSISVEADTLNEKQINISYQVQAKDLGLINDYLPTFPKISSSASLIGSVNADSKNLLFNVSLVDVFNTFDDLLVDSLVTQVTGNFRYNAQLKDFSGLDFSTYVKNLEYQDYRLQGFNLGLQLQNDSLVVRQSVDSLGINANLNLDAYVSLEDTVHTLQINEFLLGSDNYQWLNLNQSKISYNTEEKIQFEELQFINDDQLLRLNGIVSSSAEDSMQYYIENIELGDLSELINGRVDFAGVLNGNFSTKSLRRSPSIAGNVSIDAFEIGQQVVGDIDINSTFNQPLNRFDTRINILTDSTKYPDYFIRNDRTGQNIEIAGYINAPDPQTQELPDSLYYFDLNFDDIDMWIFPIIAPRVFTEMEGRVTGSGYFRGNFEDYDYKIDYSATESIYIRPRFLETYYYAQGDLVFSSAEGLVFDNFFIIDPSGGIGTLNGTYDFNQFSKNHIIDLELNLDQFHFLNNSFSIDQPFFGDAYGNGTIRMSGTSFAPIITSDGPIILTSGTSIGVPLLEETQIEQDRTFIRRVQSFDDLGLESSDQTADASITNFVNPTDLTFSERFTLDLQFETSVPMNVDLIFDNVTGDVISTQGNGRLQITLEDQDFSMFGRYDITSGNYNFVSGDIFTRRFLLNPGGNIVWEGQPDDARLNLEAVYRTRPDIRTLSCSDQVTLNDPNSIPQRRQVDLVLNIGGTISQIQNSFQFDLPNTVDNIQDNTLTTQLSALNNTEDEKLLQATSLLLTNRFVSICSTQETNSNLTEGLSGSSVVLNPLLSSQVISPLLSSQINSLLRSDVSSLDIDFNLNEFNQVDLGVALRLYNDRIIFRREGLVTGQQSNIGDIDATYRINQTISVTAFHRQDPSFNSGLSNSTQQVQDINGLGIEAQIEFDKGNELFTKIGRFFGRLFGIKRSEKKEKQTEQITESLKQSNDE